MLTTTPFKVHSCRDSRWNKNFNSQWRSGIHTATLAGIIDFLNLSCLIFDSILWNNGQLKEMVPYGRPNKKSDIRKHEICFFFFIKLFSKWKEYSDCHSFLKFFLLNYLRIFTERVLDTCRLVGRSGWLFNITNSSFCWPKDLWGDYVNRIHSLDFIWC